MPRIARAVVPECPHHITQRGNNRQGVFFVADDYRLYLDILREQSRRYGLEVHAYCLMANHVHLVATPHGADSLAKAVGRTHWRHSQAINRLHGRSGHLWQGRFYSCALDRPHFWAAVQYVERNPVRARLVRRAWDYAWSSAAAHCGDLVKAEADASGGVPGKPGLPPAERSEDVAGKPGLPPAERSGDVAVPVFQTHPAGLLDLRAWSKILEGQDWRQQLTRADDKDAVRALRDSTSRGRPLGSDSFMSKVEKLVGRRLRPLPGGRPRKKKG